MQSKVGGAGYNIESYEGIATESPNTFPGVGVRFEGMRVWATDTKRLWVWNNTAAAWQILSEPPQAWVVSQLYQGAPRAVTTNRAWYQRHHGVFRAQLFVSIAATGTAANAIFVPTPVALLNLHEIGGVYNFYDGSAGAVYSGVLTPNSTLDFLMQSASPAPGALGGAGFTAAIATGDDLRITMTGRYA